MATKIIKKYPKFADLTYTGKQRLNVPKYHLKHWDDLSNLTRTGATAICTKSPNSPIATKSGTYRKPAPIYLGEFDFKIPNGMKIEKIVIHYAHQIFTGTGTTKQKDYPAFGGPMIYCYNENTNKGLVKLPSGRGNAPTSAYTHHTLEFTNIPIKEMNIHDFGLIFAYPENTSASTGRLALGDVHIEIHYSTASIVLNASTSNPKIAKGSVFNVNLSVKQKDTTPYTPHIGLHLPSGITFVKAIGGKGSININSVNKIPYWDSTLDISRSSNITIQLKATSIGDKSIQLIDEDTETSYTLKIGVTSGKVAIVVDNNKNTVTKTVTDKGSVSGKDNIQVNTTNSYMISGSTTDNTKKSINLVIHLPLCAEIENFSELQKLYNSKVPTVTSVQNVTIKQGTNKVTVPIKVNATGNTTVNKGKVVAGVTQEQNANLSTTNDEKIISLSVPVKNGKMDIVHLQVRFNDTGIYNQIIYMDGVVVNTTTFTVRPSHYDEIAFTRVKVDEDTIHAMGDGINYTACSVANYVADTKMKYTIDDLKYNLRFGVYNGPQELVSDETEFLKHSEFTSKPFSNKAKEYKVSFTYTDRYPLYFWWSSEYLQSQNYEIIHVEFQEPELFETNTYVGYEEPALYPSPASNLISSINWASINIPAKTTTKEVTLYEWESGGLFDLKDIIIQGLQVSWEYQCKSPVELQLTVKSYNYDDNIPPKLGYRNITLDPKYTSNAIGDAWDTFGLKPHDLRNLSKLEVGVILHNTSGGSVNVRLNSFKLKIHYLRPNLTAKGFSVDGERSEEYGVFLKNDDFVWDWGTQNDVQYYETSGTDDTIAHRSNITKKELKFGFSIDECDVSESAMLLEKVSKLFTNERTKYNKPIPKCLIFDIMPQYAFWFVREDPFDTEINYGSFDCKVTLVIPTGTAENITESITGSHGSNTGVARVTPTIIANVTLEGNVTIYEAYSKQNIHIVHKDMKVGDTIIIDNTNRFVTLIKKNTSGNGSDITNGVDWSSTWFSIIGEYSFESTSCDITSIKYKERL